MLPIARGAAVAAAAFTTAIFAASTNSAVAHASLEVAQATPGSSYKAVLRILHGCKGEATHTVRVTIPEGVIAAKPMPKPGWTIAIRKGAYAKSYKLHGRPVSEGAQEIVWSGGNLPNDHFDEFVFRADLAPDLPEGGVVYFPTVQECANGAERWVEVPAPGQDAHALPRPAPRLMLAAGGASSGHDMSSQHGASPGAAPQTYKVDNLVVTAPWARATPKGAPVAGGYLSVTNNGSEPDRLVGGSFAAAGRFEVHEMKMEGGVMKMRPLANGIEIKPGETVELKPGGYHLMFMGLKQQLKAGETVKGTLEFAKAGKVEVSYPVRAQGSPGAGGHGNH